MVGQFKLYRDRRVAVEDTVRLYSEHSCPSDRVEISKHLNDEGCERAFVELNHMVASLDDWADELSSDPDIEAWLEQGEKKVARKKVWPGLAAAALVVIAVAVSLYIHMAPVDDGGSNVLRYVTATGEQKSVTLSDGSVLTLNTRSQALVDVSGDVRRVVLDRGEVYFDVARDVSRPFTVEVDGRAITVLGTEFNVRRDSDGFSLALVEGEVALHRQGQSELAGAPVLDVAEDQMLVKQVAGPVRIQAGTYLDFDVVSQRVSAKSDPNIASSQNWRRGLLSFKGDLLSDVIAELNRYSPKPIMLMDKDASGFEVYSTLNVKDINMALKGLEVSAPIKVVPMVDRIEIFAAKKTEK